MSRRKGTPEGCCGDTCGNKVRKINGISPDPNGEFSISAGTGVEIIEDVNGITIDASRAAGVLTINGQSPDADGNFDGVITGQPGSIGTNLKPVKINAQGRAVPVDNNLVDTASGQLIQGEKVFDSNTYTKIGIRSSRVSGKLGGIQFKDGSNNIVSTFEVDVDGDVHFENKPNTGVMIDNQRAYDANNETDIVTIKTMKDNAVTIADTQTITGLKTFQGGDNCLFMKSTTIDLATVGTSANARITCFDKNGNSNNDRVGILRFFRGSSGLTSAYLTIANRVSGTQTYKDLVVSCDVDGTAYAQAPSRTYHSANVTDIVTIGSLANNPNVVHTTGNESITGVKTLQNLAITYDGSSSGIIIDRNGDVTSGGAYNLIFQTIRDKNGEFLLNLWARINTNGKVDLYSTLRNADGTQRNTLLA